MNVRQLFSMARLALAVSLAAVTVGCATTVQTDRAEKSGFLKDYRQLKEGHEGEANWVYIAPDINLASYSKILISPITIWAGKDSEAADLSPEDRQMLGTYLYEALKKNLGVDYELVDKPGPGVIMLRVAITEAEGSIVILDTITSLMPQPLLISHGKALVTGMHSFVGEAWVEAEGLDSQTGKRLWAAVDSRAGGKVPDFGGTWSDVKESYDFWAVQLRNRLAAERAKGSSR
jgi:hypothetical protein